MKMLQLKLVALLALGCDPDLHQELPEARSATTDRQIAEVSLSELPEAIMKYAPDVVILEAEHWSQVTDACEEVGAQLSAPPESSAAWDGCYVWACNYIGVGICCLPNPRDCCLISNKVHTK